MKRVFGYSPLLIHLADTDLHVYLSAFTVPMKFCNFEVARIIEGIPGAANVQDNILIWSSTKEEHYKRLKLVFDCIKQAALELNRSK